MKKTLILAGILALTMTAQAFADEAKTLPQKEVPAQTQMHKPPMRPDKAKFEKRLKLTDEQKAQAKQIHQKGFEQIKPIMKQMKEKRQEIATIRLSKMAPQGQEEQIAPIKKELKELRKQAHQIRMQNMKEFEAILTPKQKKELEKIKKEGRKNFEKMHKDRMLKMPPRGENFDMPKPVME